MIYIVISIIGLLVIVTLFTYSSKSKTKTEEPPVVAPPADCCGAHAICEKGLKKNRWKNRVFRWRRTRSIQGYSLRQFRWSTNRPVPRNPLHNPSRRVVWLVYQFGETRNRTAGCSETGTQLMPNQPLPTRRNISAPILQCRQRCVSQYSRFTCNKAWDCKAEFTCTP